MREGRCGQAGVFRRVIPQSQLHSALCAGLADEVRRSRITEYAALQQQATLRVIRQPCVIFRLYRAEKSLGVDMQFNGVQNLVAKQPPEERQGAILVNIVDATQGRRIAEIMQQMSKVVQQCSSYQLVIGTVALGKICSLQRMFQLRYRFTAVLFVPMLSEQSLNISKRQHSRAGVTAMAENTF